MTIANDDRFVVTASHRTTGVVFALGEIEITVKMPSVPGLAEMTEEQVRENTLRQLRRVLQMAQTEIGD